MTTPNVEELRKLAEAAITAAKAFQAEQDHASSSALTYAEDALYSAMQSQAERIKALEAAPQVGYFYKWKDAMHGIAKLMDERDTLRAQLAQIAATEPVLIVEKEPDYWSGGHFHEGSKSHIKPTKVWCLPVGTKLFTHPMPAQDVTELVDALEKLARLGNGDRYGNSDGNMFAREALSKYKGAK